MYWIPVHSIALRFNCMTSFTYRDFRIFGAAPGKNFVQIPPQTHSVTLTHTHEITVSSVVSDPRSHLVSHEIQWPDIQGEPYGNGDLQLNPREPCTQDVRGDKGLLRGFSGTRLSDVFFRRSCDRSFRLKLYRPFQLFSSKIV